MAYSSALSHQSSYRDNLLSVDRGKAVDELLRGRDVANQLRDLLGERKFVSAGDDAVPAEDLVTKILRSFGATLSMLNSSAPSESESDEVSQIPVGHVSEDSGGDSCKSTETLRERRACYKKRKSDSTYTKVTSDLIDDGYAWRKYGQKSILHTEFPRNYFRCTHKYDKPGCQASKQVQQISKDPPRFRTTYINNHTCKNFLKPPQIIFDPTPSDTSVMMCFQTSSILGRQDPCNNYNNNLFSSTCLASTSTATHESTEEIRSDNNNNNQSSSSDYQYMTSLPDFGDQQNSNSCTTATTTTSHEFEFDDVCDLKFVVDEGGYYNYTSGYC